MLNSNTSNFKSMVNFLEKFGMALPSKASKLLHIKGIFFHVLFVTPYPVLFVLHVLLDKNLDMERLNYDAAFYIQSFCFFFKLIPLIGYGHRLRKCVEILENYQFPLIMNKRHQKILETSFQTCRRNHILFIFICFGAVGSWAIKPLFQKERLFPAEIWLPFDAKSNFIFYFIYFYVASGPVLASSATSAIDPLIAGLAFHAASHIKILNDYLQHLGLYVNEEKFRSVAEKNIEMYRRIAQLVKHHNFILSFVKEFEASVTWVFFSQISFSVFILCFICIQILQVQTFDYYSMQLGFYILVILGQLNFYCYYGSKLTETSSEVTTAVYMSNWYNYDLKCRKALITLMQRSQVPLILTAGKFVQLSLLTLATIIRRSYSLIAVFKNN